MKISKFVKIIEYDTNSFLLRNLFNGALYLISQKDFEEVANIIERGEVIDNPHLEEMYNEKFIVDDEPELFCNRNADYFLITIELTSDCNLNCTYCYEIDKGKRRKISTEVMGSILKYIENIFKNDDDHRSLCVGFIGGEPLLCKEDILYLYDEISFLCKMYNRKFWVHIDTNGTIPFNSLFNKLDNLRVSVSLTPKCDHNENRRSNSFDSFETIIENLKDIAKKNGNTLSIRYNTNEKNIGMFSEFVKYVRENIPSCDIIEPMYTDEYKYTKFRNGLALEKFKKWNSSNAIDCLIDNGYPINYDIGGMLSTCIAYQKYTCKVYSDGRVTLCDSMFHCDSLCDIFQICDKPELIEEYYTQYKHYDPVKDERCRNCIELPRCMGQLFCRQEACNYNKRFDDDLLAITFTRYFLEGKGIFFKGMN